MELVCPLTLETLKTELNGLDVRFRLLMDEVEKRNAQRFDAQQEAVGVAMVGQEKAVLAAMAAAEKAVTKAEIASEKRFESVNEFRKTLSDQTANFITRTEYAALTKGRADIWSMLISIIAIVISTSTILFKYAIH
jgi:hypothetical protein